MVAVNTQPHPLSLHDALPIFRLLSQLSLTVAAPNAAAIAAAVGLQPSVPAAATVITGSSISGVHTTVLDAPSEFPRVPLTVQHLVVVNTQPLPLSAPTVPVAV